jgi:hypothetical protein
MPGGRGHLGIESARAAGIIKAFVMKPLIKRGIAQMVRGVLDG